MKHYRAVFSTDWNECLAPCGPFDYVTFAYPELSTALDDIFRRYTGNDITLGAAVRKLTKLLPAPIHQDQMDAYLDRCFATYRNVPALIEWCLSRDILFMINTTGAVGYFQRAFHKGLLPPVPVVSAYPHPCFTAGPKKPLLELPLLETADKARNTHEIVRRHAVAFSSVFLMGDSGGDGPHFEWGRRHGAFLIGSMTKPSLTTYCRKQRIHIDCYFGRRYKPGEPRNRHHENHFDFLSLKDLISEKLDSHKISAS